MTDTGTPVHAPRPIHPGEHLAEELRELNMSAAALARQLDVPVNRVTQILNGQRPPTERNRLGPIPLHREKPTQPHSAEPDISPKRPRHRATDDRMRA